VQSAKQCFKKMNTYNYNELFPELKFDKKRSRVILCPCGKDNKDGKFVPYVGFENKGYCHSCGKTFLPELSMIDISNTRKPIQYVKPKVQPKKKIDFIPESIFKKLLIDGRNLYNENHFIKWLCNTQRGEFAFDEKTINNLIESYYLANSYKYKGWTLFPYIDINFNVRDIKAIDYNSNTGKRIAIKNGDTQNRCLFIGKEILNNQEANTDRCFYGEHLLKGNCKIVMIFESEAIATYLAAFCPERICIATGGSNGFKWTDKEKCKVLIGRKVVLYPDIDAHDSWEEKAEILRGYGIAVVVSCLLKNNTLKFAEQNRVNFNELVKLKFDLRDIFQRKKLGKSFYSEPAFPPRTIAPYNEMEVIKKPEQLKLEKWEAEIVELENFFAEIKIPTKPLKFEKCSIILNCSQFIESHLFTIKANKGNQTFLSFLERLKALMIILKSESHA